MKLASLQQATLEGTSRRRGWVLTLIASLALTTGCPAEDKSAGTEAAQDTDGTDSEDDANDSGSTTSSSSNPVISGFTLNLTAGAFWDFKWSTQHTSYGTGSPASGGVFRVVLGTPVTLGAKTAFPLTTYGNRGSFAPRWKYLAFDGGVLSASIDGSAWTSLLDPNAELSVGGGFFAELPTNTVFTLAEQSFTNSLMSASGAVRERSSSTTDTVCLPGFGCVSGGGGDTNLAQRELYQSGIGPAGYYYLFSYTQSYSTQGTTLEEVGLAASSLRGDAGLFATETEPNSQAMSATQALQASKGMLGAFAASDEGFTVNQTYYNPYGVLLGHATDIVQDCYLVDVSSADHRHLSLMWDPTITSSSFVIVLVTIADGVFAVTSTSLYSPDFSTGSLGLAIFDNHVSTYGTSFVACVGTTSTTSVAYSLLLD